MQAKTQINDAVQTGLGCVGWSTGGPGGDGLQVHGGAAWVLWWGEKTHPSEVERGTQRGSSCTLLFVPQAVPECRKEVLSLNANG